MAVILQQAFALLLHPLLHQRIGIAGGFGQQRGRKHHRVVALPEQHRAAEKVVVHRSISRRRSAEMHLGWQRFLLQTRVILQQFAPDAHPTGQRHFNQHRRQAVGQAGALADKRYLAALYQLGGADIPHQLFKAQQLGNGIAQRTGAHGGVTQYRKGFRTHRLPQPDAQTGAVIQRLQLLHPLQHLPQRQALIGTGELLAAETGLLQEGIHRQCQRIGDRQQVIHIRSGHAQRRAKQPLQQRGGQRGIGCHHHSYQERLRHHNDSGQRSASERDDSEQVANERLQGLVAVIRNASTDAELSPYAPARAPDTRAGAEC